MLRIKPIDDVYLASPFFKPDQVEREEAVKKILRDRGLTVFSPKENCFLPPTAGLQDQRKVFQDNVDAIERCRVVLAITDGKDIGTIWEAGYAFGIGIPVIYFAETLGPYGFNLMLAQSGRMVILNREDLKTADIMGAVKIDFGGLIE